MDLLQVPDGTGLVFELGVRRLRFLLKPADGCIYWDANTHFSDQDLASIVEGPVLGLMLRLQGQALLHASAVEWEGRRIAISAASGSGKSTLAELLCSQGATPWSEDILAYDPRTGTAFPDARQRRLTPAAQEVAGVAGTAHAPIYANAKKQFTDAVRVFEPAMLQPQALDHIFLLGPRISDDAPAFFPLDGIRASTALLEGRFPSWLHEPSLQRQAFADVEALSAKVPVTRLQMPEGLERARHAIPRILEWLETHAPKV